jgi:hypothetical protein
MQGKRPSQALRPWLQSMSSHQAIKPHASDRPTTGWSAGWLKAYRNPNGLQFAPQLSAPVRKPPTRTAPEPYSQRRTSSHFSHFSNFLSRIMKVRTAHRQMSCETHKGSAAAATRYSSLQRKLPASHLCIHSGSPLFGLQTAAPSKQHCKRSQYDSSARTRAASAVVQSPTLCNLPRTSVRCQLILTLLAS